MTTDILGNNITHVCGKGQKLMLVAHADVVKMMVTYVDAQGFLYLKPYGCIDVNLLPARKLVIRHGDKEIIGVGGKKPIHLMREDVKLTWDSVWVDIGAKSKAEALEMVEIGDYVYFPHSRTELLNDLITGDGLDDGCGILVLHGVSDRIKDNHADYDVYLVESNYEEIGLRGAIVAANRIQPDVCIALDVTHATDYPSMSPVKDGDIKVGAGCVLTVGPNVDDKVLNELKAIAEQQHIAYQIEPNPCLTGTDANMIQVSNIGVRTAVVSIPCRYMHTPYEVVSQKDIQAAVELISGYVSPLHVK